jgi:hypothetical protein
MRERAIQYVYQRFLRIAKINYELLDCAFVLEPTTDAISIFRNDELRQYCCAGYASNLRSIPVRKVVHNAKFVCDQLFGFAINFGVIEIRYLV